MEALSTAIIDIISWRSPLPDVVVIGAGIAGLSAAAELSERGLGVLVVDKDDIGYEQ